MSNSEDIVARLPQSTDTDEVRIVKLIKAELLSSGWAKETFRQSREILISYFRNCLDSLDDTEAIYKQTQAVLKQLASITQTKIVTGREVLEKIAPQTPVLGLVNHLGSYKLTEIRPSELGLSLPIDVIHPFPIYYAPLVPVSEILDDELLEAHVELPEPLHQIQKAAGLVIVPPKEGVLPHLIDQTGRLLNKHPHSLITVFPEGGTTGKRNGGGPYDLEEFKTGAFVIAGALNLPVLPVGQFFNPRSGFEIGVFDPIFVKPNQGKDYYRELASNTREIMQGWLNSQK